MCWVCRIGNWKIWRVTWRSAILGGCHIPHTPVAPPLSKKTLSFQKLINCAHTFFFFLEFLSSFIRPCNLLCKAYFKLWSFVVNQINSLLPFSFLYIFTQNMLEKFDERELETKRQVRRRSRLYWYWIKRWRNTMGLMFQISMLYI